MLSLDFIKQNLEEVKKCARNKRREVDFVRLLSLDEEKKKLVTESESLRAQRNQISQKGKNQTTADFEKNREIKDKLKVLEEKLKLVEEELTSLLLMVPNVYLATTPEGLDEKANVEISRWGSIPQFDFPVKDHLELAKINDLVDFERGSKVSGFRGYFLKNKAAEIELKIIFHVFNKLIAKGYVPLIAPALVKEFCFFGNGQFPWGREEVYFLEKDNQYLAGTAEVPVTAYFAGEILREEELPKKFVAFSPCYRREAGSYGKDTKGLYRVHEFLKVEQVVIAPADLNLGLELFDEILMNAEGILQDLQIPYRIVHLATGEMGEPQFKKYDIESWMPSRQAFGETMSCSLMTDFQARRLNLKYKTKEGKTKFCYTLNNTAIASPRILIPIMELNQTKTGKINWPEF